MLLGLGLDESYYFPKRAKAEQLSPKVKVNNTKGIIQGRSAQGSETTWTSDLLLAQVSVPHVQGYFSYAELQLPRPVGKPAIQVT